MFFSVFVVMRSWRSLDERFIWLEDQNAMAIYPHRFSVRFAAYALSLLCWDFYGPGLELLAGCSYPSIQAARLNGKPVLGSAWTTRYLPNSFRTCSSFELFSTGKYTSILNKIHRYSIGPYIGKYWYIDMVWDGIPVWYIPYWTILDGTIDHDHNKLLLRVPESQEYLANEKICPYVFY